MWTRRRDGKQAWEKDDDVERISKPKKGRVVLLDEHRLYKRTITCAYSIDDVLTGQQRLNIYKKIAVTFQVATAARDESLDDEREH